MLRATPRLAGALALAMAALKSECQGALLRCIVLTPKAGGELAEGAGTPSGEHYDIARADVLYLSTHEPAASENNGVVASGRRAIFVYMLFEVQCG